jgi:SH3-like domain-containing protein
MRLNGFSLTMVLALVVAGSAQAADAPGYWLRVATDKLNIRARPDLNSTILTQLMIDDPIRGIEELNGWHKILPPPGAFSYVSAAHVKQLGSGRGRVAVEEGSTLRVRVGSTVTKLDVLKSEMQTLLEPGTIVEIIAEEGDWLRIKPPPGVFAYVDGRFVAKVTGSEAAELDSRFPDWLERARESGASLQTGTAAASAPASLPPEAESLEPITEMAEEPVSLPRLTTTSQPTSAAMGAVIQEMLPVTEDDPIARGSMPAVGAGASRTTSAPESEKTESGDEPAEPAITPELLARFARAQEMYNTQNSLDPLLRNWKHVLEEYRALAATTESPILAENARARVREIERRMEDDEFLQRTDALAKRHWSEGAGSAGAPPFRERLPLTPAPTSMPQHDARGILRQAGLPADIDSTVRAQLVDPWTGSVTAYVDPGAANLAPLEGKFVAIRGTWSRGPDSVYNVLRVEQIFILPLNPRARVR